MIFDRVTFSFNQLINDEPIKQLAVENEKVDIFGWGNAKIFVPNRPRLPMVQTVRPEAWTGSIGG